MQSKSNQFLSLASKKQIIRSRDAHTLGIPRNYLSRLVRKGLLTKVGRGLFRSKTSPVTEHLSLVEASYKVPNGVISLLSALRFHKFTTQSPHEVWMSHRSQGVGPTNNFSSHSICANVWKSFSFWNEGISSSRRKSQGIHSSQDSCGLFQVSEQDRDRCSDGSSQGMPPPEESDYG